MILSCDTTFLFFTLFAVDTASFYSRLKDTEYSVKKVFFMLHYAIVFFILSAILSILGFGNLAGTCSQIAKIFALIFIGLFLLSLIRIVL